MTKTMTPNGFELDDSGQRVVVDPICRIEGHLRIEVNLDENNTIRKDVLENSNTDRVWWCGPSCCFHGGTFRNICSTWKQKGGNG